MIVEDVRGDDRDGTYELSARIRKTQLAPDGERVWFRFPAEFRPREADASPYLPGLLLACMFLQEPLVIDGPVSARLLGAAEPAKEVYRSWNPQLADVQVEAAPCKLSAAPRAAACFFTRGVDSWYSALNGVAGAPEAPTPPFTKLLYSPTADFFAGRPAEELQRELRAEAVALTREASERVGCELVVIDSNLRELVEPHRAWSYSHGGLLASMGLALGTHLGRVHIASSLRVDNVVPLGTHPDLDPLWSTERTEIVHDRADVDRVEKLRFLAEHPVALDRLKVCINKSPHANCGECSKCVRTMIGLRLAQPLTGDPKFDAPLRLRRVVGLGTSYTLERAMHRELLYEVERAGGQRAISAAMRVAIVKGWPRRTRYLRPARRLVRRARRARARLNGVRRA